MAFMKPAATFVHAKEMCEVTPLCNEFCALETRCEHQDDYENGNAVGWYGYLTAAGYMDRTDYMGPFESSDEALNAVMEFYEVDENGDDANEA